MRQRILNYKKFNKDFSVTNKRIDLDKLNKYAEKISDLGFSRDGIQIVEAFLDDNALKLLNSELDELFSEISFNKSISASARVGRYLREITKPISVRSINLLELSVDIHNLIKFQGVGKNLILTNLEIFSESNNGKYLPFHTDQRQGMYRAQIYLKGGSKSSGGFAYIAGTHNINHSVEHHLSREEVKECEPFIYNMAGNPGDLIMFDSLGFHGKDVCVDERRIIIFEFQENDSDYVKASLNIDNQKLTPKVVDNLSLFMPGCSTTYGNHGLDSMSNNLITASMVLYVAKKYFSCVKSRIAAKINRIIKL